ncbi:MAG: YbaB/EbfC family nucleoid-associated protein [Bacteroidota bacterium]|nr:MAG: YbaB/EbfC family nucleoid-associated protein [Bacteroidota bacterium]
MFGKLAEAQKKMQEIKDRLETIIVTGESEQGKVIAEANGNNRIRSITINESLFKVGDKNEVEELITVAVNRALEASEKLMQGEMVAASKDILPGFLQK